MSSGDCDERFLPPSEPLSRRVLATLRSYREQLLCGDLSGAQAAYPDLVSLTDLVTRIAASSNRHASYQQRVEFLQDVCARDCGVAGVLNFRDMGGISAGGGRRVRARTLYRCANPFAWTPPEAIARIAKLGVATVLDLRTTEEIARSPDALAGEARAYVALPLFTEPERAQIEPSHAAVPERYHALLRLCQSRIARAASRIADPCSGPTLVHCKVGKDRTGLLVALVLDAVGASREQLALDYSLSAPLLLPFYEAVRDREDLPTSGSSFAATLEQVFRIVDDQFGGSAQYLIAGGMRSDEIEALEKKLLA